LVARKEWTGHSLLTVQLRKYWLLSMSKSDLVTEASSKVRTCYVAALINADLQAIEELLLERQLQPMVSADLSPTASTFLEGVVDAISNADLFLAVLSSKQQNDNIYIELGIAIAKERRILILAPLDVPVMLDIAEIPAIRTDVTNRNAISFMLDQVLAAPPRKYRPHSPVSATQKGQPIGDLADELLEKLEASGEHVREDKIVQLVMLALQSSGNSTIENNPLLADGKPDRRADHIVWSDELGPWIGNPLVIEVKRTLKEPRRAVEQVLSYLQLSQTRSALILYANKAASIGNLASISPPNIFFLDVHELLTAMRTKSFAKVMIDLRNRRVHGIDVL
jgi:hypothetical protein